MIGGNIPDDPSYWKAHAERHAELLRSGKSTFGVVGVMTDLLLDVCGWIFAGIARLWRKRS
jgi:hypothetical protein